MVSSLEEIPQLLTGIEVVAALWERYICLSVVLQYKVFDMILLKIIMVVSRDVILVSEKIDKVLFDTFWSLYSFLHF